MERVKKGEKYWSIDKYGSIQEYLECGSILNDYHYESFIYFHTEEETRVMRDKLRAVLQGADVIEMPSEQEIRKHYAEMMINNPDYHLHTSANVYINVVDWLKSKIVK